MDRSLLSEPARRTLASLDLAFAHAPNEHAAIGAWLTTFYRYQLEWLLDWSRFSILLKARQIGASHVYAAAAVLWAMLGETTTIVSVGDREASEVLVKAKAHAMALRRLGSVLATSTKDSATMAGFASGGRVIALPQTSGGRSYSGNVVLDEFAYLPRPEEVWDGAAGTVTHGYKLRCLSTPNGEGNLFELLWKSRRANGYTGHAVTIDDAIADGLRVNWGDLRKQARGDDRIFDQLFRCKFLDGDAQYIPSSLIEGACEEHTWLHEGDAYGGLDIGRTNDRTSLYVVRVGEEGALWVQHSYTSKRTSSDDLEAIVAEAFQAFRLRRLCVDATGIGAFPAERLQKIHGLHRVEPVTFTLGSKEDLATTLFSVLSEKRLKIPASDRELKTDLASIKRIITSAGNVRYDAPTTAEGHADRAWALALAVHAATQPAGRKREVHERRF